MIQAIYHKRTYSTTYFFLVNDNRYHYILLIPAVRLADHVKKYYNESRSFMKEDVF